MNKRLPDEVYEALAPGSTAKPEIPAGMFAFEDDLRKIAAGLLHDGLDVSKSSPMARAELRGAIDTILRLAE